MRLTLFAAALVLAASAEAAAEPLKPGQWTVDWGESRCTIATQGSGEKPATFLLQALPGSTYYSIWLINPAWDDLSAARLKTMAVVLEPSNMPPMVPGLFGKSDAGGAIVVGELHQEILAAFRAARAIHVEREGKLLLELPLQKTAAAAEALRDCEEEVLRDWGIDPEAYFALRSPPRSARSLAAYLKADDYPASAIRDNASGAVVMRLDVGADGRVTACTPVISSGHVALDSRSCEVLKERAEFTPATGADGTAVSAPITAQIEWRID